MHHYLIRWYYFIHEDFINFLYIYLCYINWSLIIYLLTGYYYTLFDNLIIDNPIQLDRIHSIIITIYP